MGAVATLRAALVGALVGYALPASAQTAPAAQRPTPSRVRIEPPACATGPFDRASWLSLVRNELETDGVHEVVVEAAPQGDDSSLAVIHMEVDPCREDATEVAVTIDDLVTRKTVRRVVALDDIPRTGRSRALALAVAELLRASWAEVALTGSPVADAPLPPPVRRAVLLRLRPAVLAETAPVTVPVIPPPVLPRSWLGGGFEVRTFPGQSGALFGARVFFSRRLWEGFPMRLRVDAGGAYGTAFARHGEIDLWMASVGVGALFGGGNDQFDLTLGPRIEGGWAGARGRPEMGDATGGEGNGPLLVATLTTTLRATLWRSLWVALDVSIGQTLVHVTVYDGSDRAAGLRGPSLAAAGVLGGQW
jgi:hypothetical protein